jgi:uncharacterized repeat protein (TIGR01451 family)
MEEYNPNGRWTSKKKKVDYTPPEPAYIPKARPVEHGVQQVSYKPAGSGKKIAIVVVVAVVVLAGAYGTWFLLTRPISPPVVGLSFAAPSQVLAGDPFPFSVSYNNSSTVPLRNASLVVSLPNGVFFSGEPQAEQTMTIPVGDVAAGDSSSTNFELLATAGAANVVQVSSTLSYSTDASHGALYTSSYRGTVTVGSPIIELSIGAPANIFAGQDFQTQISYQNTTKSEIDGAEIAMQYPQGFTFVQGSPAPAFPGNTIWDLGSLSPGAGGTIVITGTMSGQNTALYSLSGTVTRTISGTAYAVAAGAANVAITAAPLMITAVANNDPNYIAKLDDYLDYTITYTNVSQTTFQNVAITAALQGEMFDPSSVQSPASFNSRTDTLTWYPANTPALISVAPGATGSVDLRVKTRSSFPIATPTDKDFSLGLHLTASSLTVPAGTVATSTSAAADVTNKMGGVTTISAVGYRYEPEAGIQNSGPYPPQVNQATTYTIHWIVTNYSTDVNGVTVSAYLQSGATCTGKMTSTIATQPACDPATGAVTWAIPSIAAGTGVLNAPIEAVFQVEDTPAVNQVGQTVTFLGKTSLTAADEFTGATISASADPVDTGVPQDKGVTESATRTVQD